MRFYFDEDNQVPRCVLCGNYHSRELFYCDLCKEYLCRHTCENKWSLRGAAMMEKGRRKLSERFA